MRSHNWVVQGCAGEGSEGRGVALTPTAPVVLGWRFLGLSAVKALYPGHACPLRPAGGIPSHPQTRALSLSCCLLLRREEHAALSPSLPRTQAPAPDSRRPSPAGSAWLWEAGGKDRLLTLPVCQPCQQQGSRSQVGRGVGSQAGMQQGELAEEAAQVLGSWCHGDQRQ